MRPDQTDDRRVGTPLIPQRSLLNTPSPDATPRRSPQDAAAQLVRGQIDTIYSGQTSTPTPQTTPHTTPTVQTDLQVSNPYERTHTPNPHPQADQWKQYHSAWQDYYQKYYERYYVSQVHEAHKALAEKAKTLNVDAPVPSSTARPDSTNDSIDKNQALHQLRNDLREKVMASARQLRASRHFTPVIAALSVVLVFSFLQYNRVLIGSVQAYVMPGSIDPQNIIVDPNTQEEVGPDPKLIIPKINVEVPVVYGVGNDEASQLKAMESGVAQFSIPGASSVPGQIGNTVLSGHSSNDILDGGDYKFIFAQLEKLEEGDTIYANYEGKRYSYVVTKKEVVLPTQVDKLVYETDKPVLTLITCTPLGTALKRLLVTAEQVSPNPASTAVAAPEMDTSAQEAPIPGNSPTFVERLFGAN